MQQQETTTNGLVLLRTKGMRYGALGVCVWQFLVAIGDMTRAPRPRQFGIWTSDVMGWANPTVLLCLNLAFYGWLMWVAVSLVRNCRVVGERLLVIAFIGGLLLRTAVAAALPSALETGVTVVDFFLWLLACGGVLKIVLAHRREDSAATSPYTPRGWGRQVMVYVGELLLATIGSLAAVRAALHLLFPLAHLLMPTLAPKQFTSLAFMRFFPLEATTAFAFGYFAGEQLRNRAASFVWVIPAALLVVYVITFRPASVMDSYWPTVWGQLFGAECRPPRCYDQVLVVAPLISAAAFSVGASIQFQRRQGTATSVQ